MLNVIKKLTISKLCEDDVMIPVLYNNNTKKTRNCC